MHNVQEHKEVGDRQNWLQEKLKEIIIFSPKPRHAEAGNVRKASQEECFKTKDIPS